MEEIQSVTFDKDKYHLHRDMEQWCRDHIGPGQWSYATPKTWEGMGNSRWLMHSMFGRTTFCFKDKRDLTMFLLRWMCD